MMTCGETLRTWSACASLGGSVGGVGIFPPRSFQESGTVFSATPWLHDRTFESGVKPSPQIATVRLPERLVTYFVT